MKVYIFIILTIFIFSCTEKNISDKGDNTPVAVNILFNSIKHDKIFFVDEPSNPLIVLRSLEEQEQFLDTTSTLTNSFDFSSYQDSMLIVLRSPLKLSVSNHFAIDSIVVDSSTNEITVHAHNYSPINKMSLSSIQTHIVSIPQSDYNIDLNLCDTFESTEDTILDFHNFLQSGGSFSYNSDTPLLVTLKSNAEQDSFLNEINYSSSFPEFNYTDSMLVGVLSQTFNHITPFEIVSIIQVEDTNEVSTQYYSIGTLPSIESSYHFVAIEKNESPFIQVSNTQVLPYYY